MSERITPKVGDTIWIFDDNRRVYARDEKGRVTGGPVWREHWRPVNIEGETRVSWICGWGRIKINKKSPGCMVAFSQEEIDRGAYVEDATLRLRERVWRCRDYDKLKAIESILDADASHE